MKCQVVASPDGEGVTQLLWVFLNDFFLSVSHILGQIRVAVRIWADWLCLGDHVFESDGVSGRRWAERQP